MAKYGSEQILPYNNEEHKTTQVRRMFDSIAGTYDQLNHTLSLGIDKIWRRKGIAFLRPFSPASILDIATGTGDLAISMHRRLKADRIIGADISEGMMEVGRQKVAEAGLSDHITFEYQDCTALTYPDNSFDAVTAAFGVRNFENIEQGITEMYRVLKPGGHLMILELSSPVHFPMKQLYNIYSKVVIPTVGSCGNCGRQGWLLRRPLLVPSRGHGLSGNQRSLVLWLYATSPRESLATLHQP